MKLRNIISAVVLLVLASSVSAQEQLKKHFEKIENYNGITHVSESKSQATDSLGITVTSRIVIMQVSEGYFGDLDKLREIFESEGSRASMYYSHVTDHFSDGNDTVSRKQFLITNEGTTPTIVGRMKNSTYFIANFDDPAHPGYRTCYAAEWTETDDPDPRPLQLTYVYGRKPASQTSIIQRMRYSATAEWPKENVADSQPQDIPMKNGNTREWMQQAITHVTHLSASDWQRFFGLLTQEMITRPGDTEDMLVAANLVLDLCKNSDQLDDDERQLALRRLQMMSNGDIIQDPYVCDLLRLGCKKLEKK